MSSGDQVYKSKNGPLFYFLSKGIGELQAFCYLYPALDNKGIKWIFTSDLPEIHSKLCHQIKPNLVVYFASNAKMHNWSGVQTRLIMSVVMPRLQKKLRSNLSFFDACLTPCDTNQVQKFCSKPVIPFYYSVFPTPFKSFLRQRLFFVGSNWDNDRKNTYKTLYNQLDDIGYLNVYGPEKSWAEHKLQGYAGHLPFSSTSVIEAIQSCGVYLLLHSTCHIQSGAPTGRLFEALSASAVIISDDHPFVRKEFGDSVPYIDHTKDNDTIFKEINTHMGWIFNNQDKANELAKKSHEIFLEKFSADHQVDTLLRLIEA